MRASSVLLSAMLLIPIACGDDEDDGDTVGIAGNDQNGGTGGRNGGASSGTAGMGAEAGAGTTASAGAEGETAGAGGMGGSMAALTDGEILQVMDTANSGEIEQGELARELAVMTDVREFADGMVTQHTANRQRAESLASSANITLEQHPLAEELETKSEAIVATLQATPEEQFDLLYMQLQVDAHSGVLELLDENLIPEADTQEVQDYLTETRSVVADHLERAEALVEALEE